MKSIASLEELYSEAARIVSSLAACPDCATVLALSGDLGAGKTAFTQQVAKFLGVTDSVTSPTFVLEKIYPLENQKWERLVHIDAYRLETIDELSTIGWSELLHDPRNLILIEWPEMITEAIPEDAMKLRFDIQGDERIISVHGKEKDSV